MINGDLIIDCFAGGGGASVGIEMALGRPVDIAINHDPQAIRIHKINHPSTLHLTEDIFKVDLQKYVGGRHVALMWASPDCTSHSKAKGGQPRKRGLRILPWAVYKTCKKQFCRMLSLWRMWKKSNSGDRWIRMGIRYQSAREKIIRNLYLQCNPLGTHLKAESS